MSNIFVRSPYYVGVVGVANDETRVDLYIWNGTGAAPGTVTKTLSKIIPSSVITTALYNISPYLREYITFNSSISVSNYDTITTTNQDQYCNVIAKTYLNGVLVETLTHRAFDGYGEYLDGMNYAQTYDVHLDEGTYYYYYDTVNSIATEDSIRAGKIQLVTGTVNFSKVKYTNLDTAATVTTNLTSDRTTRVPRIYYTYYGSRVKTELSVVSSFE